MAEYIERDAAIDAIMKVYVRTAGYKARERVFEAEEAVHRLPAADVAPVVHGHRVDDGGFYARCSQCDGVLPFCANYCPNCGAKMNGGADDAAD